MNLFTCGGADDVLEVIWLRWKDDKCPTVSINLGPLLKPVAACDDFPAKKT
jgi:hypothetical protein